MRYRKLSSDGDYSFGQGSLNFHVDNADAVAQAIKTRLLLLTGEWFLDVTEGTNYAGKILGTGTAATRDLEVKSRILKTPGVKELLGYASKVIDRQFTVQAIVSTVYGTTPVQVAFP